MDSDAFSDEDDDAGDRNDDSKRTNKKKSKGVSSTCMPDTANLLVNNSFSIHDRVA